MPGCREERLVVFSCKGRGFCPSCGGRRMAERAAHLVDHVWPDVSVRQWVLSLPPRVRYCRVDVRCRAAADIDDLPLGEIGIPTDDVAPPSSMRNVGLTHPSHSQSSRLATRAPRSELRQRITFPGG